MGLWWPCDLTQLLFYLFSFLMSSSVHPLQCRHLIRIEPSLIASYIRKRPQPLQYTGFGSLSLRFLVILRVVIFYFSASQTPAKIPITSITAAILNRVLASSLVIPNSQHLLRLSLHYKQLCHLNWANPHTHRLYWVCRRGLFAT